MTQQISNLNWQPVSDAQDDWASVQELSIADTYVFTNIGSALPDAASKPLQPIYLTVDNTTQTDVVTIVYGPFTWTVMPYNRQTFTLPNVNQALYITVNLVPIRITFATTQYANDAANGIAIQNAANALVQAYPPGHLYGLTLSNNSVDATNDLDIASGTCRDSTNQYNMDLVAMTKRLDATWSAGNGNGMRDTGAIANGTWHIFVIKDIVNEIVDVLASLSPTAPTLPVGYTVFRRIGSIPRVSATLIPFYQRGDLFDLLSRGTYTTIQYTNPGAGAHIADFSQMIPVGVLFNLRTIFSLIDTAGTVIGGICGESTANLSGASGAKWDLLISGSGDIQQVIREVPLDRLDGTLDYYITASVATTTVRFNPIGWIDYRGRTGPT